jgi:hypothetical protein
MEVMEDRLLLQRLDQKLILKILMDARSGICADQPGISNSSMLSNHRRYIILLSDYGLVTTEPCDSEVGGCYPCTVRLTGITFDGERYLEWLLPSVDITDRSWFQEGSLK